MLNVILLIHKLSEIMLSVIMLSVIMLRVIMLSVIMLCVSLCQVSLHLSDVPYVEFCKYIHCCDYQYAQCHLAQS